MKWPGRVEVDQRVRVWAETEVPRHPEILRLGYFGSYARGDHGVGSDLDLVALVDRSSERFERRGVTWRLETLPIPADILVYTADEWNRLCRAGGRFIETLERETVWVYTSVPSSLPKTP
jgi:predicted nucleotidyltransferase